MNAPVRPDASPIRQIWGLVAVRHVVTIPFGQGAKLEVPNLGTTQQRLF